MKYLKISSLLVLSLLLLAPSAQAAVNCTLSTSLDEIRMESNMEMLEDLTITCTWDANDIGTITGPTAGSFGPPVVAGAAATGAKFNLELDLNGMLSEDAAAPKLKLLDLSDSTSPTLTENNAASDGIKNTTVDKEGYRSVAGEVSGSGRSVIWPDVVFPATWAVGSNNTAGSTITLTGVAVNASSVNDDRVEAVMVLTGTGISTEDDADIARVKQALDLEFGAGQKAEKFNACEPGTETISINVVEGFRKAWKSGNMANDIMLVTSSGTIKAKDTSPLNVTDEGGGSSLIIDVSDAKDSKDDTTALAIDFTPTMGGSGDITLSAMLLPHRSEEDDMFIKSADLVVGSFDVCTGESLFFPFVTTVSGWDTGIAVVNDSEVDGSCSLNWNNLKLTAAQMEALSSIDVKSKNHHVFQVSQHRSDHNGSLGVQCTFSSAHGYIFLYDGLNETGQGYIVEGK